VSHQHLFGVFCLGIAQITTSAVAKRVRLERALQSQFLLDFLAPIFWARAWPLKVLPRIVDYRFLV
jgi:hypothetical protein